MSVFSNPSKTVEATVYGNYLKQKGFYRHCKAVKIEELPETNTGSALRIDWQVDNELYPNISQVISDFIPRDTSDGAIKFIINHAYELALAVGDEPLSRTKSIEWAEDTYNNAVKEGVYADIELMPVQTESGKIRYNVTYSKCQH